MKPTKDKSTNQFEKNMKSIKRNLIAIKIMGVIIFICCIIQLICAFHKAISDNTPWSSDDTLILECTHDPESE